MKAYQVFFPYYRRQIIELSPENREEFLECVRNHPRYMLKEKRGAKGIGTRLIDIDATEESADAFFEKCI